MKGKKKAALTKQLIEVLKSNNSLQTLQIAPGFKHLVDHAAKNKMLLQLLRVLDINDNLRSTQEKAFKKMLDVIKILSRYLKDYDHAFFKLVKPVTYVPADVDLLVNARHVKRVVKTIESIKYKIVAKDPFCITLAKDDSIIDVYTYPSLGGMIFIDGQKLLKHTSETVFNNVQIRSLEPYAEAVVVAAHAIYKERIYTLNDYFTFKKRVSKKSFKLAEELYCKGALEFAISLNKKVDKVLLGLPYKIPMPLWFKLLIQKFCSDELTRRTSMNLIEALTNRRSGKLFLAKLTGEIY